MTRRIATIVAALALGLAVNAAAAAEVVVVVSADSPVDTLTRSQLADIFLGNRASFPDGDPAVPIDLAESEPAHDAFYQQYLNRSAAQIRAHWSKRIFTGRGRPPRSVADAEAMAAAVADIPGAIGYIERERVDERLEVVPVE